jgi:hypothetical protein
MFFILPDILVSTIYLVLDKAQHRQLQSIINQPGEID